LESLGGQGMLTLFSMRLLQIKEMGFVGFIGNGGI